MAHTTIFTDSTFKIDKNYYSETVLGECKYKRKRKKYKKIYK